MSADLNTHVMHDWVKDSLGDNNTEWFLNQIARNEWNDFLDANL